MNDCDLPGRHFESYLVFPYIHIIFDAVIVNVATGEFGPRHPQAVLTSFVGRFVARIASI